jgi:hypothetical protein
LVQLKLAIWRSGRPQYEIAAAAGLSATTLSMIVVGRRKASRIERQQLARVLGASERTIFATEPRS